MTIKGRRYDSLRNSISEVDGVTKVELDEEWIPPHKMAAFTPYDAIVSLEDTEELWTQTNFEELIDEYGVRYDRVITLESAGDGTHEAFISLATGEEQGLVASSD